MVEDSIVKIFSGSSVSVVGVDVIGSTDLDIERYIAATNSTFPVALDGGTIWNSYLVDHIGIVVIDQIGIVRLIGQFELESDSTANYKMMSDVVSTVRTLLENRIVRPKATAAFAGRNSNSQQRYYTLSGQTIAHPIMSVRSGFIVRRLDGRVTGVARFAKPNP
jgi:hypothetical protein